MQKTENYYSPNILTPFITSFRMTGTTFESSSAQLTINKNFKEDKPVEIIDEMIEINEDLIKEDEIYQIKFKGELFYVRRNNNSIEVFQIQE